MTRALAVAALAAALLTGATASAGPDAGCAAGEWPQPRQSACATASVDPADAPTPTAAASIALVWSADLGGAVGNPIVGGDRVYVTVGTRPARLEALDLATGRPLWSAPSGHRGRLTPLLDSDFLLRMTPTHLLRRYDPLDGRVVWRRDIPSNLEGPVQQQTSSDGRWYQSQGEELVAYDESRGEELWRRWLMCFYCTVAVSGDRVFAAGAQNEEDRGLLYAFDAATGVPVWSVAGFGELNTISSPMVEGGTVYVVTTRSTPSWAFYLEAFRADDGLPLWRTRLTKPGEAPGFDPLSAPAVGDGIVVYPGTDRLLHAVDAETGARRWTAAIGATASSPAIGAGVVWIVDDSGALDAFAVSDGRKLWAASPVHRLQYSSPVLAGGLVLVGSPDGRLLAWGSS